MIGPPVGQNRTHSPQSAVLQRFYGPFAALCDPGNLSNRQAFEKAEDDHMLLFVGQVLECMHYLGPVRDLVGESTCFGRTGQGTGGIGAAHFAPDVVDCQVVGNAVEPGTKGDTLVAKALNTAYGIEEDIGCHILGNIAVAETAKKVAIDGVVVGGEDLFPGAGVHLPGALNERLSP